MKKTFKKIIAATLSAAMIFGGSVMTFADTNTVTSEALTATGTEGEIEDLLNKQVYQVKLPTTTFVTNHFSNIKLDPQGLVWETSGDAYKNVSGIAVGFANPDAVTAGSILFRKEVYVTNNAVTAVTYDTVSTTLEAVNCGTVPITINAVTTISGLAASGGTISIKMDKDGKFTDNASSGAAIWLAVTGASTYSNADPATPATEASVVFPYAGNSSATNAVSSTVVQAVSGAPSTTYAVTTVATTVTSGETVMTHKSYQYQPVAEVLTKVAADRDDKQISVSSAISGMAIDTEHKAFGRFQFVMQGIANPGADYQAWKPFKDVSLALDIVWVIEYDKNADDRTVAEEDDDEEENEEENVTYNEITVPATGKATVKVAKTPSSLTTDWYDGNMLEITNGWGATYDADTKTISFDTGVSDGLRSDTSHTFTVTFSDSTTANLTFAE